jgi:hypothetical protein
LAATAASVVDVFGEHVAEIAFGVGVEHGRIQRFQQFAVLADQAARAGGDIELVDRGGTCQKFCVRGQNS